MKKKKISRTFFRSIQFFGNNFNCIIGQLVFSFDDIIEFIFNEILKMIDINFIKYVKTK